MARGRRILTRDCIRYRPAGNRTSTTSNPERKESSSRDVGQIRGPRGREGESGEAIAGQAEGYCEESGRSAVGIKQALGGLDRFDIFIGNSVDWGAVVRDPLQI